MLAAEMLLQLVRTFLQGFERRFEEEGEIVFALYAAAAEDFLREFFDGAFSCHGGCLVSFKICHRFPLYFRRRA